jgi:hemophore-related protein
MAIGRSEFATMAVGRLEQWPIARALVRGTPLAELWVGACRTVAGERLPMSAMRGTFGQCPCRFCTDIVLFGGNGEFGVTIFNPLRTRVIVLAGFATLALSGGTGLASAAPDANTLANTTCSYNQMVAAVNAEVPGEASGINNSSQLQGMLRDLLAAGPSERLSMIQRAQGNFFVSDDIGAMIQVADSCNKY